MVSTMRVPPVNCACAMLRMRRTILRSRNIAGGKTISVTANSSGSWITITTIKPASVMKSRPAAMMSRASTCVAAFAPACSRAVNSEECRSVKKPRFLAQQPVEHALLVRRRDAVADARQQHGLAVERGAAHDEDRDA